MLDDILEQPATVAELLERPEPREAARLLTERAPRLVRLIAHGSSHNAALYGSYAVTNLLGLPCSLPSLASLLSYGASEDLSQDAVIGVSQSGHTHDVVDYIAAARRSGALTLAITNDPGSPLACEADFTVPIAAGIESAIPATKTYLNTIVAFAMIVAEAGAAQLAPALGRLPALVDEQIGRSESQAEAAAARLLASSGAVAVGRGYDIVSAREIALKVTESARISTGHMSVVELLHGPIAALEPNFAVLLVATRGAVIDDIRRTWKAITESGAEVIAIGNVLNEGTYVERLDVLAVPEVLAPMLSLIPGQLLAYRAALLGGVDPNAPRGLTKVVSAA
jgi:glucosamine--fructose-6-phosphate aminotransferase (isomerizing)